MSHPTEDSIHAKFVADGYLEALFRYPVGSKPNTPFDVSAGGNVRWGASATDAV